MTKNIFYKNGDVSIIKTWLPGACELGLHEYKYVLCKNDKEVKEITHLEAFEYKGNTIR